MAQPLVVASFVLGVVGSLFGISAFILSIIALVKNNKLVKSVQKADREHLQSVSNNITEDLRAELANAEGERGGMQVLMKQTVQELLENVVPFTKHALLYGDINPDFPRELYGVLPHFHSIIALCVAGGLIQCVLTIDMIFDWQVALDPSDETAKMRCFTYYHTILNSLFVPMKTTIVVFVVSFGSFQAFRGSYSLDAQATPKTGIRVSTSFHIIMVLYMFMIVSIYLLGGWGAGGGGGGM